MSVSSEIDFGYDHASKVHPDLRAGQGWLAIEAGVAPARGQAEP
jgi:hypothetical protein